MKDNEMTITGHLEEFRKRIMIIAIAVVIGFIGCYNFSNDILLLLKRPLNTNLVFIAPAEAFLINLKLSLFAGIFLAMPVILLQIWKFIVPALLDNEKKYYMLFVITASIFFVTGSSFAYYIILPYSIKFLLEFSTESLQPMISVSKYLSFSTKLILSFGIAFELPIVVVFLSKLGLVTPRFLSKNRKYAILIIFAAAAILTPPDVITQLLMAGPLIILFEISILAAKVVGKKRMEEGGREDMAAENAQRS